MRGEYVGVMIYFLDSFAFTNDVSGEDDVREDLFLCVKGEKENPFLGGMGEVIKDVFLDLIRDGEREVWKEVFLDRLIGEETGA